MDKVLTRKMFKDRYFKSLKPTVKHFQAGGLGSLSPKEKSSAGRARLSYQGGMVIKQMEKVGYFIFWVLDN